MKNPFPLPPGIRYVSSSKKFRLVPRFTQPPSQWMTGVLSLEGRQPGHEDDHLPASSAKVNNECSCTSTLSCVLMACTRTTG